MGFQGSVDSGGQAAALQPDGKIVMVGMLSFGSSAAGSGVARYSPDGTLDASFGNGGTVIQSNLQWIQGLAIDANDKIVGLITLEDVVEEIVGDIEDEHDRPPPKMKLRRRLQLPRPAPPVAPAKPAPGIVKGK